jgi:hypothetical protein
MGAEPHPSLCPLRFRRWAIHAGRREICKPWCPAVVEEAAGWGRVGGAGSAPHASSLPRSLSTSGAPPTPPAYAGRTAGFNKGLKLPRAFARRESQYYSELEASRSRDPPLKLLRYVGIELLDAASPHLLRTEFKRPVPGTAVRPRRMHGGLRQEEGGVAPRTSSLTSTRLPTPPRKHVSSPVSSILFTGRSGAINIEKRSNRLCGLSPLCTCREWMFQLCSLFMAFLSCAPKCQPVYIVWGSLDRCIWGLGVGDMLEMLWVSLLKALLDHDGARCCARPFLVRISSTKSWNAPVSNLNEKF